MTWTLAVCSVRTLRHWVGQGESSLMVFTSGHVTRGAAAWAEKASVPVFWGLENPTELRAKNRLATEHLPLDLRI